MGRFLLVILTVMLMGGGCIFDQKEVSKCSEGQSNWYGYCVQNSGSGVVITTTPSSFNEDRLMKLEEKVDQLIEAGGYVEFTEPSVPEVPAKTYLTNDPEKKKEMRQRCTNRIFLAYPICFSHDSFNEEQKKVYQKCIEKQEEFKKAEEKCVALEKQFKD